MMTTLDIAKLIIKEYFNKADAGLFNTRNIANDTMINIYHGERLEINICYDWGYFEVLGLTSEEFNELLKYYEELKKMAKTLNIDMNFEKNKKCPFRKIYHFKGGFDQKYDTNIKNAEKIIEEFQDCIGEKCAFYGLGCNMVK